MKVYLAAQVLSNSVANALEYCHAKVKDWENKDVTGTVKFLRIIDMLFDRMNSKNPFGKYLKSPLSVFNKEEIFKDFAIAEAYILSLGTREPTLEAANGEPQVKKMRTDSLIINGPRKQGFIGFLVNMATYKKMFELYIQTGYLKYLLTYKTSQDHVEHLFCAIRGSLGKNNNPSTREFTTSLKKILLGATHHSEFSNCVIQDDTAVVPLPANLEEAFVIKDLESNDEEEYWSKEYMDSLSTLSEYKSDVLVYIAGKVET